MLTNVTNGSDVKGVFPLTNGSDVKDALPLTNGSDVKYVYPGCVLPSHLERQGADVLVGFGRFPQAGARQALLVAVIDVLHLNLPGQQTAEALSGREGRRGWRWGRTAPQPVRTTDC